MDILEGFDEDHRRMTRSEIGSRVGLARTTCLRLLQSVEAGGYLMRVSDHDLWYGLSLKMLNLDLVRHVDVMLDIPTIVYQLLPELEDQTGATVTLNIRNGSERSASTSCSPTCN